ncbi:MAG: hypothetical protein LBT09_10415 [Planctomycetaceae bacterium]|jgi:hypothetical protein|nr:hypothetical protein [Planctomycetaceae bacterium]
MIFVNCATVERGKIQEVWGLSMFDATGIVFYTDRRQICEFCTIGKTLLNPAILGQEKTWTTQDKGTFKSLFCLGRCPNLVLSGWATIAIALGIVQSVRNDNY